MGSGTNGTFIKRGPPAKLAQYAAEFTGLAAIRDTGAVRVPEVINYGTDDDGAFIELERLDLRPLTADAAARLGRELARLHKTDWHAFGWTIDTFIGDTSQPNDFVSDWPEFFAQYRLRYQVELAEQNGFSGPTTRRARKLIDRLPELLDHQPRPSLIHGDLWAGNHGMLPDGTPVVFDPAVHFADRECDLAMAALFGGFRPEFFDAYIETWPMAPGWQTRWKIYQLYHVLNHVNLFGSGYLAQAEALLAEIGG